MRTRYITQADGLSVSGDFTEAMPEALIIEDDPSMRYLLQFLLEQQGYQVRSASNARQGREAIKDGPAGNAVLVVLDLMLPDENGLKLLACLRADHRWDQVPVLVLSALCDESTMREVFAAGGDDYASKPFDPSKAAVRIERLIQSRRTGTKRLSVTP